MNTKNYGAKELAIRALEERFAPQRESYLEFLKYYFKKEFNREFLVDPFHIELTNRLEKIFNGEIDRLMINVAPGAGKTEMITKLFPVWCFGKRKDYQVLATGYSEDLALSFSGEARDAYASETFKEVFPRAKDIRKDLNNRKKWGNYDKNIYYASGALGTITGLRFHLAILDDPIKPDEVNFESYRNKIKRWFDQTIYSRLHSSETSEVPPAIIIVMQRLDKDDLCGYLLEKEERGGDIWEKFSVPAIAEMDEEWRKAGESYNPSRFPVSALERIRNNDAMVFETQYQQNPTSAYFQEFYPEHFKYYDKTPTEGRVFTVLDPAFSQKKGADDCCVMSAKFLHDKLYILEYTTFKYDPVKLTETLVYHARKWDPEKIGIETVAAQEVLFQQIKHAFTENKLYKNVVPITTRSNKEHRIRSLKGFIQHSQLYWKKEMAQLEAQLKQFPNGKHDDVIDAITLFYQLYEIRSKTEFGKAVSVFYDHLGRPMFKVN